MLLANEELRKIVVREVETLGYVLWGVEIIPNRYSYLIRVYIDGKPTVDVSDCEKVNRQLAMCLRKEDYSFEVSSPGLARKFFELEQYKDYIGKEIQLRTRVSINGRRNHGGQLLSVDKTMLVVQAKDEIMRISYNQIEKGQLRPDYTNIFIR